MPGAVCAQDAAGSPVQAAALAMVDANTLQKDGRLPFHWKTDFEVFDLYGKPEEQGSLEYWWAGADGFRLEVMAPSIGTVHETRWSAMATPEGRRTLFLAEELLNDMRFPGSVLGLPKTQVKSVPLTAGTIHLDCVEPLPPAGRPAPEFPTEVCTDPQNGTIRLVKTADYAIARNRLAKFGGVDVALDLTIQWGGSVSIKGQTKLLQRFAPANSGVVLEKPAERPAGAATPPGSARIAGGVVAGNKIGGAAPVYPMGARERRVAGTVVMMAVISKEGTISSLTPLMSPDLLLTDAAVEAVRRWTYRPYLLNGQPVEVSTTITVNFNLSGGYR